MTYKNKNAPVEQRVNDLLSKMTIEEKIGQMIQLPAKQGIDEENYVKKLEEWHIGSFLHCTGMETNKIQKKAAATRLGIPILFGIDAIHGHCFENSATVFPTQLAMSCSWNTELLKQAAAVTAKEVRVTGIHWTFSPVLCIGRDPRWGRIDETFGEDPWLIGELGCAMVEGYQGKDLSADTSVLACVKHFAGYGESIGGRDSYESDISKRKMLSLFLPPFKKAVHQSGAATIMAGYQAIDGQPASGNSWLLRETAKENWEFNGVIVTDWNNVGSLNSQQSVAADYREAAALAVNAGNDMIMSTESFYESALMLHSLGELDVSQLDDSVSRILRLKFLLGLFDNQSEVTEKRMKEILGCESHWDTALETSRQSIVLLENNGALPLEDLNNKKILLTGPNADDIVAQLGDWSFGSMQAGLTDEAFHREDTVTLLTALTEASEVTGFDLEYVKGADTVDPDFDEISLASEKAAQADIVIACVGDTLALHGEGHDRSSLSLTGNQQKLLEAMRKTAKTLIVVLISSKPLTIPWIKDNADAFICSFNPGAKGGRALKEIITGEYNPCGKLTISFPHSTGQLPVYYNKYAGWHAWNTDGSERYLDAPAEPTYDFGMGLSYTTFSYSDLKVLTPLLSKEENPLFSITVKNSGDRAGVEIVQLYIRDIVSSVTTPVKSLKAFQRVELQAGEKKSIQMTVDYRDLAIVTPDLKDLVEPGEFEVFIGSSSRDQDLCKAVFVLR